MTMFGRIDKQIGGQNDEGSGAVRWESEASEHKSNILIHRRMN